MADILNLKGKCRSNHKNNLKYEFLDPKNPKKHVLHIIVGQLVEKLKFKMADGGHFGFEALTHSARPFAIGAQAKYFFNLYR